ncbi:hypothetical protein [Litorivivens sp.]|uniref:hypothetical protein n=1 Tax=Litorivivens sp. TaxID=2020868 RepID=UPI003564EFA2
MFYSHEMVALLQQLRLPIQSEFGVRIRLADPDLLLSLGDIGHRSRNPFTRNTITKLMRLAEIPYASSVDTTENAAQTRTTEITYRGQKISKQATPTAEPAQAKHSKQIYRGQVVVR